jgi:hypothetical protein
MLNRSLGEAPPLPLKQPPDASVLRLLVSDTGSHACAAGAHTRASTKAGVGPLFMSDPLLARNTTDEFRLDSAGADVPAVRATRGKSASYGRCALQRKSRSVWPAPRGRPLVGYADTGDGDRVAAPVMERSSEGLV